MWGQLRIIQGGPLKIRETGKNSNMKGHTKFLEGFEKNRGDKAFRGPVTERCIQNVLLKVHLDIQVIECFSFNCSPIGIDLMPTRKDAVLLTHVIGEGGHSA